MGTGTGFGVGPQRRHRPEDLGGQRHQPGHRLGRDRRPRRRRLRRHHRSHHRRHTGPRREDRSPDRRPESRTSACRTRRWSPRTPTGRSGSPWPATPAPRSRRTAWGRSTTTRSAAPNGAEAVGADRPGPCSTTIPSSPATPEGPRRSDRSRRARCPPRPIRGYDLAASDGGIFTFGCHALLRLHRRCPPQRPRGRHGHGRRLGRLLGGGRRRRHLRLRRRRLLRVHGRSALNAPIVGMAATPDGGGYWLVASDGGIFAFGDAALPRLDGGEHLNSPVVGMSSSTRRRAATGWWPPTAGSSPSATPPSPARRAARHLNEPVVGTANDVNTGGYWEVAADGGVFSFGGAPFYGSTGGTPPQCPDRGHGRDLQRERLPVRGGRRRRLQLLRPVLRLDGGDAHWPDRWWAWPDSDPRCGRPAGEA